MLWIDFSESYSDFSLEFLDFRSDMIKKPGIIILCSYGTMSYVCNSCDSKKDFLAEENDAAFHPFSVAFCFYSTLHNRRRMWSNFLVLHTSRSNSLRSAAVQGFFQFYFKLFFRKLFYFDVSFVNDNLFGCLINDLIRVSKDILEIFFLLVKTFFLADWF